MVEITPDIKNRFPAVFKVARREKMRVVWLETELVYCARRGKGHDKYLVKFDVSRDGRVSIGCKSISGRVCDGMVFKGLCAHAAKVILRGLPEKRKKQSDKENSVIIFPLVNERGRNARL